MPGSENGTLADKLPAEVSDLVSKFLAAASLYGHTPEIRNQAWQKSQYGFLKIGNSWAADRHELYHSSLLCYLAHMQATSPTCCVLSAQATAASAVWKAHTNASPASIPEPAVD